MPATVHGATAVDVETDDPMTRACDRGAVS